MAAVADLRLPGVYFLPAVRAAALDLPPLDVAGFVGFATRGPLDLPVPIEDLSSFDAIFGGPFALARDDDGRPVYAYLRDAVAAFFACGGRRCYVVRVAGGNATSARFAVPGLVTIKSSDDVRRAQIAASSAGIWGAELRLGTILTITQLPPNTFSVAGATALSWTTTGAPQAVREGDLLRLTFPHKRQWLVPVTEVTPFGPEDQPHATVRADAVWPVRTSLAASPLPPVAAVRPMSVTGPGAPLDVVASFAAVDRGIGLWLTGPAAFKVIRDDILLLELTDGSQHLLAVADAQAQLSPGSLPASGLSVIATDMLCLRDASGNRTPLPVSSARLERVERLQLSLRIKYGDANARGLDALGFNAAHPRFWGDVAVAESGLLAGGPARSAGALQQQSQTLPPAAATELYKQLFGDQRSDIDWTEPRLKTVLSTLLAPAPATAARDPSGATEPLTYLPVGMPLIGSDDNLVGADPFTAKDDLTSFGPQPFLDPNLVDDSVTPSLADGSVAPGGGLTVPSVLLSAATDLYFLQNIKLKGIHSLMFVDEVALIAAPDAAQRGWALRRDTLVSPAPGAAVAPTPRALFADCAVPVAILSVDPALGPDIGGTPVEIVGSGFAPADSVRVTFGGRAAAAVHVSDGTRLTCLTPAATASGPATVAISNGDRSASLAGAFLYTQPTTTAPLPTTIPVASYPTYTLPTLQTIHAALLRLCQARADVVAILALPLHFEKQECVGWLQSFRQILGLPRHGIVFADAREIADLSYAAVYHPWLLIQDPNGPSGALRPIPPDGAICGAIAAREIARWVWFAPGNAALPGVLDLQPAFSNDDWAALFALGFNLVRPEPKDFRVMSAHTLADDQSLLQLSVRRLLIQLRKAALQRGQDYVFGKNDERFRQRVRHQLEDLMRFMFDRGAFAGTTQPSSYRVAVDDSLNTRGDIDQGRVIAQILVAPSQPMEFLTVLLTRTGDGQLQTAEG